MSRRPAAWLAATLSLSLFFGGLGVMRAWGENWGASEAERRQRLSGDQVVPDAVRTSTMAITIHVPIQEVWPWLAQFGAGRGGLYSYDWFQNMVGCQMTDAPAVIPTFQNVRPGDEVRMCAGSFAPPSWTVAMVEPGHALILGKQDPAGTAWLATDALVLIPVDSHTTRLFWRNRTTNASVIDLLIGPGAFVMQRGSLLGMQERAEGRIFPWYARESELLVWLISFGGFVVAVASTALRRRWDLSFAAALLAALVTLGGVLFMPPLWLDVVGAVLVWAGVGWSFVSRRARSGWHLPRSRNQRALST